MKKNALDCSTGFLGSGQRNCVRSKFGDVIGTVLFQVSNDTKFENDNPLNRESYKELMKELKAFPYLRSYEFTDNTPDNEVNTSTSGQTAVVRQALPMYQMVYTKGSCFHKSLYNKKDRYWQAAIVFEEGILLTYTANNEARGFNISPLNVETYRLASGTDLERTITNIQILDAEEFNKNNVFFTWEALGFDLREELGVIDVELSVENSVSGSDEIQVLVKSSCNDEDVILGLDDALFWSVSGATVTTVTQDADTGVYTITLGSNLPSTGNVTIKLSKDGVDVIEDDAGELLKGKVTVSLVPISA